MLELGPGELVQGLQVRGALVLERGWARAARVLGPEERAVGVALPDNDQVELVEA
jgi:hypothetical protein